MTALSGTATGAVRYDLPQGLTSNQMAQGRANIGVAKKNYIINGAMQVSQENGTTVGTVNGYYPADQYFTVLSHAGVVTANQTNVTPTPAGSINRIQYIVTTADTSVAAGDYHIIQQRIEGLRVADLMFGTASAKTVTLQFGVRAPAGTYCIAINNGAFDRSYVAEYTIAAGEANTDVVRSVTIPGDVTGTWAKDNSIGFTVYFALMGGSTFQAPANVWTAGNKFATANQFNFLGTVNNTFHLFDVSLTEGTVAPPFQVPDYASELALCQRYYQQSFEPGGIAAAGFIEFDWAASAAGTLGGGSIILSPTMRSAPAVNVYDVAGNPNLITVINAGGALTNGQTYNQLTATPKNLRLRLYSIAGAVGLAFQYRVSARL